VPLVGLAASLANKGKIMKFLSKVDKQKVQLKPIKVRGLITKAPKNTGAKNPKRASQMVGGS
jgi:hypothetical protein